MQLTSFVGRDRETSDLKKLLTTDARLLTLTGPGGSGKTRLALAAASELAEHFEDGVWFVELAPLSDPDLVPQTVAAALSVRETPERSMTEALVEYLEGREILLILDNCEHLVASCAALSDTLLRACPKLRILATSREALEVAGETHFGVPPLSSPDPATSPPGSWSVSSRCAYSWSGPATAGQTSYWTLITRWRWRRSVVSSTAFHWL